MTVDIHTGEIVAPMTEAEALDFVCYILTAQEELPRRIVDAYQRRAWIALGYESWDAMCSEEGIQLRLPRDERQEIVFELRSAGMSTRAIGSALGVGKSTVDRDLDESSVPDGTDELPETVTSLDGRQRPASRPTPEPEPEVVDAELVDEPETGGGEHEHRPPTQAEQPSPPLPQRRSPLPDQANRAGWELRKATERIERIAEDDRFVTNKQQMADMLAGHLSHAIEVCQDVLDRINSRKES